MKPVKVKFTKRNIDINKDQITEYEGSLIGFGLDAGEHTGSWTTGMVIMPDGKFMNIPIERLTLSEPFKEEDWPA